MFKKISDIINAQPLFALTAALTIFVTALYGYGENDVFNFFSYVMLLIYVIHPKASEKPFFWLIYILMFLPIIYYGWTFVGNQKFIHLYLLCFLFLGTLYKQHEEKILYFASIYSLFLVFFIASIWKLSIHDFRSGEFLEYAFLSGLTFDFYTALIQSASLSPEKWLEVYHSILIPNRINIHTLQAGVDEGAITLIHTDRIILFSKILTVLLLVTQVTISLSLLLYHVTKKPIFAYIMHIFICEFIIFAYYPTQVIGFGLLLCIIGLIHSHFTVQKFKPVYIALMVLLLIYDLPLHIWLMNGNIEYLTSY